MDLPQIYSVISDYQNIIRELGVEPLEYEDLNDGKKPTAKKILAHCYYMCGKVLAGMDKDKAMRWLCFIQGCFWCLGVRKIADMKEDNRSPEVDKVSSEG